MRLSNAQILTATALLLPPIALIVPLGAAPLFVVMILALFVLHLVNRGQFDAFREPFFLMTGIFLLWAAISLIWTPEPARGLRTVSKLAVLFAGGLLAIASTRYLTHKERETCGTTLLIGVIGATIYLSIEMYGQGPIRSAILKFFEEPAYQSFFLNRPTSIIVLMLWPAIIVLQQRFSPWVGCVALAIAFGMLAPAESATALVALGAGGLVYLIASVRRLTQAVRIVCTVGVALSILALPLFTGISDRIDSWNATSGVENSLAHRLYIWDFAASRTLEKPVAGWGIESARGLARGTPQISEQRPGESGVEARKRYFMSARMPLHPHNAGLQIWVELGAIGSLLFAGMVGWMMWSAGDRRKWGIASAPMMGLTTTALAIASSGFGIWQSWWMSSLWLAAILTLAVTKRPAPHPVRNGN